MGLLRKEGRSVGVWLMQRLCRHDGLLVPENCVERKGIGMEVSGIARRRATRKDEVKRMKLVQEHAADGHPFRMLAVLGEQTRASLAIEVVRNFSAEDVVVVRDVLGAILGAPAHLEADNGPELVSKAVQAWCAECSTGTLYTDPELQWQTAIVKSFNSRIRNELMSSEFFDTLAAARYLIER
jgi:putative transposase